VTVRDYLDRIHADVDPEPTLATLCTLHEQHLYVAPFEILYIHFEEHFDLVLEEVSCTSDDS